MKKRRDVNCVFHVQYDQNTPETVQRGWSSSTENVYKLEIYIFRWTQKNKTSNRFPVIFTTISPRTNVEGTCTPSGHIANRARWYFLNPYFYVDSSLEQYSKSYEDSSSQKKKEEENSKDTYKLYNLVQRVIPKGQRRVQETKKKKLKKSVTSWKNSFNPPAPPSAVLVPFYELWIRLRS